ncbi:lpsE [Symbiodinium natans]|uniref:LpsE protein n=1 Tax=Symbiodinium natans TaxID=878477 RepID=A0A812KSS2_9DINO|nr:lpsE [Symbiodinium natans]
MALNIVLHEDLTMRGGAQIWLADCGKRLSEVGHHITFILPEDSLILPDVEGYAKTIVKYTHEKSAEDPGSYQEAFTEVLKPAQVCVTLVRQIRKNYQNVSFMAKCIKDAGLKTFLISKTGTFDPTYKKEFYGGDLLETEPPQCCTVTIAEFTRQSIIEAFGIKPQFIQTIYNGTDTEKFKRTPEMAVEAKKRYPIEEGKFVVGSIGRFVAAKGQKVLLRAVKKLVDTGKVPNVHVLMVGEGDLKEDIEKMVVDLGLSSAVSIYPFTKEPFYVFEACDCIALASFLEGLPNALLEALAMEKPCVASRIYGMPEVVVDGETGYCFEAGKVEDEATWDAMAEGCAEAIAKIAALDDAGRQAMAANGKKLVFEGHDKAAQMKGD